LTQLAQWLPLLSEVRGSTPVDGYFEVFVICLLERAKKRPEWQ